MFLSHLPIEIMRIVSLNRLRKSRRWFGRNLCGEQYPRLDTAIGISSDAQLRFIRRRAAGVEGSSFSSAVRMEHIARIRTAIAEGRYHVSAADLAQKLVDHMVARCAAKP